MVIQLKKPCTIFVAAKSFNHPITERITLPRICSCIRNLSTNLPISIIAVAARSIAIIEASKALTRSFPFSLINFSSSGITSSEILTASFSNAGIKAYPILSADCANCNLNFSILPARVFAAAAACPFDVSANCFCIALKSFDLIAAASRGIPSLVNAVKLPLYARERAVATWPTLRPDCAATSVAKASNP